MELMCNEMDSIVHSYEDPVLKEDRVLQNLLSSEDRYLPSPSYFKCVQSDVNAWMRKIVTDWMLEVCEEQRCNEEVFPLAVNYLDRVLSVLDVRRSELQLLTAVCMLIASKLKDCVPLTIQKLVIYTDYSITCENIMDWEMLVLAKLKWDLSSITPHAFLDQIMCRLSVEKTRAQTIKRHAKTFVSTICCKDFKFAIYPPSMTASASVSAAVNGLMGNLWSASDRAHLLEELQEITGIDVDCIKACEEQIEQALQANAPIDDRERPSAMTPTDVLDVVF